jgi:hypothetical protein
VDVHVRCDDRDEEDEDRDPDEVGALAPQEPGNGHRASLSGRAENSLSRGAVFCSKDGHCLYDLLLRQRLGELAGDVVLVVSNHADNRPAAEYFGLPFEVVPVTITSSPTARSDTLTVSSLVTFVEDEVVTVTVSPFPSFTVNVDPSTDATVPVTKEPVVFPEPPLGAPFGALRPAFVSVAPSS